MCEEHLNIVILSDLLTASTCLLPVCQEKETNFHSLFIILYLVVFVFCTNLKLFLYMYFGYL